MLYSKNLVNGAFSELYHANSATSGDNNAAYDSLNRLTTFRRGTLTSSGNNGSSLDTITSGNLNSTSGVPNTNSWSLDAIGNWNTGAGVSNTFNSQNEEVSNNGNTLVYDNNGNLTTDESGNHLTYDAWNHLVKANNSTNTITYGTFTYGPLGLQIINNNGSGDNHAYYSAQGQVIENRFTTDYVQNVFGLSYLNDVILRDRNADDNAGTGNLGKTGSGLEEREYAQHDIQYSVISLTDRTGSVTERFIYDPYGSHTVLTASWAAGSDGTNYWGYFFQGMELRDSAGDGRLISLTRTYDPALGRWMGQDVDRYINGMNIYEAYGDNPTIYVDPDGTSRIGAIVDYFTRPIRQTLGLHWNLHTDPIPGEPVPARPPTPQVYICSRQAQVVGGRVGTYILGKNHRWIVVVYPDGHRVAAGMGNMKGVPGQGGQTSPDWPYSGTAVQDHSGEPTDHGILMPNADAEAVVQQLTLHKPLGPWVPCLNDCNSFAADVVKVASPPAPPTPWERVGELIDSGMYGPN